MPGPKSGYLWREGRKVSPCGFSPGPLPVVCTAPATVRRLALRPIFSRTWRGGKPMIRRYVCFQRPCNGNLGIPDLTKHRLAERLAFLGWSLKIMRGKQQLEPASLIWRLGLESRAVVDRRLNRRLLKNPGKRSVNFPPVQ